MRSRHPRSARFYPLPEGEAVPQTLVQPGVSEAGPGSFRHTTAFRGRSILVANADVEAGVPRCSFGCGVAVLAVLEPARAVRRPRHQQVVAWSAWLPVKRPERPANVGAGVVDPRRLPGLSAICV